MGTCSAVGCSAVGSSAVGCSAVGCSAVGSSAVGSAVGDCVVAGRGVARTTFLRLGSFRGVAVGDGATVGVGDAVGVGRGGSEVARAAIGFRTGALAFDTLRLAEAVGSRAIWRAGVCTCGAVTTSEIGSMAPESASIAADGVAATV